MAEIVASLKNLWCGKGGAIHGVGGAVRIEIRNTEYRVLDKKTLEDRPGREWCGRFPSDVFSASYSTNPNKSSSKKQPAAIAGRRRNGQNPGYDHVPGDSPAHGRQGAWRPPRPESRVEMVWVVLMGAPISEAPEMTTAAAVSAAKP